MVVAGAAVNDATVPVNADTLGGRPANDYVTDEEVVYYSGDIAIDETVPLNADTLQGYKASDFATTDWVKGEIANAQLGGGSDEGEIDLSGFALKADVTAEIDNKISNIDYPVDSVNGKTGAVQLSAADVGARPNTWMPSAGDVGARPNTWLPTVAEIGAAPASHSHTSVNDIVPEWAGGVTYDQANCLAGWYVDGNTVKIKCVDKGYLVPSSRTINGKALGSNISLNPSDVGAVHCTHLWPDTPGHNRYGFLLSSSGNHYGESYGDNYYLSIDSDYNVKSGLQLNGSTEIDWNKIYTKRTPPTPSEIGAVSIDDLWTNASLVGNPTTTMQTFASQTISLNWSQYKLIKIIAAGWDSYASIDIVASAGNVGRLSSVSVNDTGTVLGAYRNATIQSGGILFSNEITTTIHGQMSQNNRLVPLKIYGIK